MGCRPSSAQPAAGGNSASPIPRQFPSPVTAEGRADTAGMLQLVYDEGTLAEFEQQMRQREDEEDDRRDREQRLEREAEERRKAEEEEAARLRELDYQAFEREQEEEHRKLLEDLRTGQIRQDRFVVGDDAPGAPRRHPELWQADAADVWRPAPSEPDVWRPAPTPEPDVWRPAPAPEPDVWRPAHVRQAGDSSSMSSSTCGGGGGGGETPSSTPSVRSRRERASGLSLPSSVEEHPHPPEPFDTSRVTQGRPSLPHLPRQRHVYEVGGGAADRRELLPHEHVLDDDEFDVY